MKNRANRRHHLQRMKKKARRIAQYSWGISSSTQLKRCERNANHLALCSCMGCGNPRYHFKSITKQEYRSFLKLLEESDLENQVQYFRRKFL
jgi:hypothetical protein